VSSVEDLNGLLAAVVRRVIAGAQGVSGLRRLSGGASQETWAFEAVASEGAPLSLILRRAPGGDRQHESAVGLEGEAELIRLAGAAGVPEPPVHYVLQPADGIGRGFIVGFVEGETLGRKIVRDEKFAEARKTLAWRCGQVMAMIHAIPTDKLPKLRIASAHQRVEEIYTRYKADGRPRPVISLAFEWLRANLPPSPAKPILVHGDFRNGNLIIGPDGLRAVLDWEIAHLGDPIEDLGWICVGPWRFGGIDKPVGGFGLREELIAGYQAGGGGKVELEHIKFWEVLGSTSWGVSCSAMTHTFRDGVDSTADRAMIARRSSENEIDLMNLLVPRR
jgi:aminoglycoside phosphotransferase (APT) family kinase protein